MLLSPCFSLLLVFASGSSSFFLLGLIRLAFRHRIRFSVGPSLLPRLPLCYYYYWVHLFLSLCFSLLSFSSGFSDSLHAVFCLSIVCMPGCVSFPTALFFFSLFASFLLLQGLAAFPKLRLLHSCFSWGFLFFTGFIFGFSSYLPRFMYCLLCFLFMGYAPSFLVLFLFVRHLCLSSALVAW